MLKGTKPRFLGTKFPHQDFAEKILSKYRFFRRDFLGGTSLVFRKKVNSKANYDTPLHFFMLDVRLLYPSSSIQQPLYIFQRRYFQQAEERHFINKTSPGIITRLLQATRSLALKPADQKAPDEAVYLPGQKKMASGTTDVSTLAGLPGKAGLIQGQQVGAGMIQVQLAGLNLGQPAEPIKVQQAGTGLIKSLPAGTIQALPAEVRLGAYGFARSPLYLYMKHAGKRAAGRRGQSKQVFPETARDVFAGHYFPGPVEKKVPEWIGELSEILQAKLQTLWSSIFTYSALTKVGRRSAGDRQGTYGPLGDPGGRSIEKAGVTAGARYVQLSAEISRQLSRGKAIPEQAGERGKPAGKPSLQQEIFSRHPSFSREISVPLQYSVFSSLLREPGIHALKHFVLSGKRRILVRDSYIHETYPQHPVFSGNIEVSGKESGIVEFALLHPGLMVKKDASTPAGPAGRAGLVQALAAGLIQGKPIGVGLAQAGPTGAGKIQALPVKAGWIYSRLIEAALIQAQLAGLIQGQQAESGLIQSLQAGTIKVLLPAKAGLRAYGFARTPLHLYTRHAGKRAAGRRGQSGQAILETARDVFAGHYFPGPVEKTVPERIGELGGILQAKLQNLWSNISTYSALTKVSRGPAGDRQGTYGPLGDPGGRSIEKAGITAGERYVQLSAKISRQLSREKAVSEQAGRRGKPTGNPSLQDIFSRYPSISRKISDLPRYSAFRSLLREPGIQEIALKHLVFSSKRKLPVRDSHIQESVFPNHPVFSGKIEIPGKESGIVEFALLDPGLIVKKDVSTLAGPPHGRAGLAQAGLTEAGLIQALPAGLIKAQLTGIGLIQTLPAETRWIHSRLIEAVLIQAQLAELILGQRAETIKGQPTGARLIQALAAGVIQRQSIGAGLAPAGAGTFETLPAEAGLRAYGFARNPLHLYMRHAGKRAAGRRGQAGQVIPETARYVFAGHYLPGLVEKTSLEHIGELGEILQAKLQTLWSSIFTYSEPAKARLRPARDRQGTYGILGDPGDRSIEKAGIPAGERYVQLSAEISRQLSREKAVPEQASRRGKPTGKPYLKQELFSLHPSFSRKMSDLPRYSAFRSLLREPGIQEIALKHLVFSSKRKLPVRDSHIQGSVFPNHPVFSGKIEIPGKESGIVEFALLDPGLIVKKDVSTLAGPPHGRAGLAQEGLTGAGMIQALPAKAGWIYSRLNEAGLIQALPARLHQAQAAGVIQGQPIGAGLVKAQTAGLIQAQQTGVRLIQTLPAETGWIHSRLIEAALIQAHLAGLILGQRAETIKGQPTGARLIQALAAGVIQRQSIGAGLAPAGAGTFEALPAEAGLRAYGFARNPLHLYMRHAGERSAGRRGQAGQVIPETARDVFTGHYLPGLVEKTSLEHIGELGEILQAKLQTLWRSIFTYSAPAKARFRLAGDMQGTYGLLGDPGGRSIEKAGIKAGERYVQLSAEISRQLSREKALLELAGKRGKPTGKPYLKQELFSLHPSFSRKISDLPRYSAFSSLIIEPGIQEIALKHFVLSSKRRIPVRDSHIHASAYPQHPVFSGKIEVSGKESGILEIALLRPVQQVIQLLAEKSHRRTILKEDRRGIVPDKYWRVKTLQPSRTQSYSENEERKILLSRIENSLVQKNLTVETDRIRITPVEGLSLYHPRAKTKSDRIERPSESRFAASSPPIPRMDFLRPRVASESSYQDAGSSKTPVQTEINMEKVNVPTSQEPKIDINKIVDKVYIEIERKIKFEKQRRGL